MPRKTKYTDEQVEKEIARLLESPHVKMAKAEEKRRYRRRQYMYMLQSLERQGKKLEAAGLAADLLSDEEFDDYSSKLAST